MQRITEIGPFTRMLLTLLVTVAVYFALSPVVDWQARLLVAWCVGALFFLVQIGSMFASLDADGVKARIGRRFGDGHTPILVGGVLIALVSVGAVIYLLHNAQTHGRNYRLHLAFSPIAIAASWMVLQTMFAVYYARLYYQSPKPGGRGGIGDGLRFATDVPPDYWDFLYFSCTLAMCYQVSDIAVTSRFVRIVALTQSLICFFYYTVIIGLVMNVIGTVF